MGTFVMNDMGIQASVKIYNVWNTHLLGARTIFGAFLDGIDYMYVWWFSY